LTTVPVKRPGAFAGAPPADAGHSDRAASTAASKRRARLDGMELRFTR
jgi:hypothetical protein